MKSYIKNILSAGVLIVPLLFVGCKDDFDIEPAIMPDYGDSYFVLGTLDAPVSRVSYDELTSTFEEGDIVGVFALNDDLSKVDGQPENVQYNVTNKSYTGDDSKEYKVLEPATATVLQKHLPKYLFYYPYDENMTFEKINAKFDHTVMTDQSEEENYEKSDLLWTVENAGSKKRVDVVLDHAMALITVTIDEVNFDPHNGASLLNVLPTAKDVSLRSGKWDGEDDNKIDRENGGYTATGEKTDIKMFSYKAVSTGHEFRVAVPAQTLKAGTRILKVGFNEKGHGKSGTFSLRDDLELRAGYNYRFRVSTKPVPIPDYGDDDSWVLDVLDPETGEQVGLLCREYIRYQPQNTLTGNNLGVDQITFPYPENQEEKAGSRDVSATLKGITMSSQAWVFYNMNGNSPDLSHGQILRVIYDIRSNFNGGISGMGAWPEPYQSGSADYLGKHQSHTFNLSDHGHDWIYDGIYGRSTREDEKDSWKDQRYYEFWDKKGDKYYTMHGSWIWWCGFHNLIYDFKLYDGKRVSNSVAYKSGHIAIPKKGEPYVSFEEIDESNSIKDFDGNKVGITVPHYLVDSRATKDGFDEIIRYPIVKIGYNQFWMSKSLKTEILNDAFKTELTDYSTHENMNPNDFHDDKFFGPGYIYPYKYTHPEGEDTSEWDVEKLYNTNALLSDGFVPKSGIANETYTVPNKLQIGLLWNYVGWRAYNKLMSGDIIDDNGKYLLIKKNPPKTINEAYARGFLNTRNGRCANVSGFNLRANGYRGTQTSSWPENGAIGEYITLLLRPEDNSKENVVMGAQAGKFDSDLPFTDLFKCSQIQVQDWNNLHAKYNQGAVFAPVRLFLSFLSQEKLSCDGFCTPNAPSRPSQRNDAPTANPVKSRSGGCFSASRDVYVEIFK